MREVALMDGSRVVSFTHIIIYSIYLEQQPDETHHVPAWNWCSTLEKKRYFPVFLLTGFVGFDGQW